MRGLQLIGDDIYYRGEKVAEVTVEESTLRASFENYIDLDPRVKEDNES